MNTIPLSGLRRRDNLDAQKEMSDGVSTFTQALIYKAAARKESMHPADFAEHVGAPRRVIEYLKADAGGLTATQSIGAQFIDYLRNTSALDAMARWMIPAQPHGLYSIKSTAWTADETGEGAAKPVHAATFTESALSPKKATAIVVASKEFMLQPIANITNYISRALRDAVAVQMNTSFFTGVEGLAGGVGSPGGTMADTLADLRELVKMVSYGEQSKLFLFVNPDQAVWLASMAMSVGSNDMSPQGGKFFGMQVMVSDSLPTNTIYAVDAAGVAWWDGGISQSVTDQAMVEMSTVPAGSSTTPTTGNTKFVSLFQDNSTGFRVERPFAFKVVKPNSVASLSEVNWGEMDSPTSSGA